MVTLDSLPEFFKIDDPARAAAAINDSLTMSSG
jgi:hypothetical protein